LHIIYKMTEKIYKWLDLIIPWLLSHGLKIVLIIASAFIFNKLLKKIIEKTVRITVSPDNFQSKEAEKKREDTLIHIFTITSKIAIWAIAILMVLQEFGIMIGPILAAAGIVGLAFGFGGQYLIRDIISGLFIFLENQYRIGDVVSLNDTSGLVENISLRMTTLRDIDGTVHHIPHGEIKMVSNMSKDFSRINLDIGIGYDTDLEHVIEVVNRIGLELSIDPLWKDSILKPPQFLRVNDLADSAIVIKVLGETLPLKQWEVTGEYRKRILIAFRKEGIEIPFPQRVLHQAKEK
jgi:moderate conductance mechanosensitive channel